MKHNENQGEKMSNFIPNSFQIPNAFIDEMLDKISGNACKVYLLIVRKTRGWGKEKDYISYSQIQKMTGISSATVSKVIDELLTVGLINVKIGNEKSANQYSLNDVFGTLENKVGSEKGTLETKGATLKNEVQGTLKTKDTENNSFKTTREKTSEEQNQKNSLAENPKIQNLTELENPTPQETFEFLKSSLAFGSDFGIISKREINLAEITALTAEVSAYWSTKNLTKQQILAKILGSVSRLGATERIEKYTLSQTSQPTASAPVTASTGFSDPIPTQNDPKVLAMIAQARAKRLGVA